MTKVLILGSNSRLFHRIGESVFSGCDVVHFSISSLDKLPSDNFDFVFYFGYHKKLDVEIEFLRLVLESVTFDRFVFFSSAVVNLSSDFDAYAYVRNKKSVESFLSEKLQAKLIFWRLPRVVDSLEGSYGLVCLCNDLRTSITEVLLGGYSGRVEISEFRLDSDNFFMFYKFFTPKYFLLFSRFLDLILRFLGRRVYGYSYWLWFHS